MNKLMKSCKYIPSQDWISWFLPIFLFGLEIFSTPNGLAQSPDSSGYLLGANSILRGIGFEQAPAHFPPLYPALLGLFGYIFNENILYGARILHGLIWAINGLLILRLFRPFQVSKLILAILVFVVSTHYAHVFINLWLWTEPLFLMLMMLNMLYFREMILKGQYSFQSIVILGVISGFALLDRYAGIALVLCNMGVILFTINRQELVKRVSFTFLAGAIPFLMLLTWLIHNIIYSGTATNRKVEMHLPSVEKIGGGLSVIGNWFLGTFLGRDSSILLLAGSALLGLIIIIASAWVAYRFLFGSDSRVQLDLITAGLFGCFAVVDFIFLIVSISFFDAGTPLDRRILSPVFICAAVVVFYLICNIKTSNLNRKSIIIIYIFLLLLSIPRSIQWIELNRSIGLEHGKTFNDQTKL